MQMYDGKMSGNHSGMGQTATCIMQMKQLVCQQNRVSTQWHMHTGRFTWKTNTLQLME
jgi:hypothetical protein